MINPDDPLDVQVTKQQRIIDALLRRAGRQHEVGGSAYSLFQSAIALQGEVWAKTRDLERALDTLGRASNELEVARVDRDQTSRNLTAALAAMEGGFALFTDGKLQVSNDLFKSLLPDISERIVPGMSYDAYFDALDSSASLADDAGRHHHAMQVARKGPGLNAAISFVMELRGDRWFQFRLQRTNADSVIVMQTEITDIVRKNRSEKDQLIDMQAHYLQAAFDNMSLGICTFSRDGRIMLRNDRFGELLGLPYTLVQKGTSFTAVLDFVKANSELLAGPHGVDFDGWVERIRSEGRLRERLRLADGQVVEMHVYRLPDRGLLVDLKDVTLESETTDLLERRVQERTFELTDANARLREHAAEQARVEEELRLAKEAAEAAVSSKTRFLAAASHDLLQPVNAAKLFISNLSEMVRGTNLSETVERLEGSFASMESLLHSLLDISRLESTGTGLKPAVFCLDRLMTNVREDYAPLAQKKGIRLDVVPSSVWVKSDHQYLLRSLQNLVVNAIQYTETGRVLAGCRRRGDKVVLEVWDTGIGISLKDQSRIFEEFTRADNVPPGSGMGLGLSIVDRTCRHLGHKVSVRSKPGVGSVFSIEMETVPARAKVQPALPDRSVDTGDMDLIVLLVENDPDVRLATTQTLERWGASVLGTSSTRKALELVADIGMAPDIIVADYQLDGDDTGVAAILALREATGTAIPAIMITADRSETLVQVGAECDFTVLTKPVQVSRLRALLDWKTRSTSRADAVITDKSSA